MNLSAANNAFPPRRPLRGIRAEHAVQACGGFLWSDVFMNPIGGRQSRTRFTMRSRRGCATRLGKISAACRDGRCIPRYRATGSSVRPTFKSSTLEWASFALKT
ncbi:hypothetical protein WN51_13045 [Melipona quadrifasciata]|uniref:Uncharacterized protein n=1 Tax=Melipona quadrifasciata TaxID=166423 RepID=A0A0N0BKG9_9HYME|nr:hypothetical protein WN51_13045 [Melipona quadrifasciata]